MAPVFVLVVRVRILGQSRLLYQERLQDIYHLVEKCEWM